MLKKSTMSILTVATVVGLLALPASASTLVYEGFNYGTAGAARSGSDLLQGQPDGNGGDIDATGLGGTWQDSSGPGTGGDLFLSSGSLTFGDLQTSGNHVRSDTNQNSDLFSRPVTAGLGGGSDLWFSILANKLQNNFSAAEGGLVIGNQAVNNPRILLDTGATGLAGFGVAPTTSGNNWTAYAWNGSAQTVGDAVYGVPTNGSEVNLLIGHISFDTGSGGADQYTLYYYTKGLANITADMGNLNQICSTIAVDVNQGDLDTLSLTRQVNTAYDEIRVATTLDEAIGIPEPTSLGLIGLVGLGALLRRRRG